MELQEKKALQALAVRIRMAALDAIHGIGSGHIGGAMSIGDVLAVLYGREMRYDPKPPPRSSRSCRARWSARSTRCASRSGRV